MTTVVAPAGRPGFLSDAELDDEVERLYTADLEGQGYVAHLTRVWAPRRRRWPCCPTCSNGARRAPGSTSGSGRSSSRPPPRPGRLVLLARLGNQAGLARGRRGGDEHWRAGYDDGQIFSVTLFVALRLAFSTVNDALGAPPDAELVGRAPASVRTAVTFGRPPAPSA